MPTNIINMPSLSFLSTIGNVWENMHAARTESENNLILSGVGNL
jgi:hypothetical protein